MNPPDLDVSVVLPTRDRWQLLRRALRCALRQEGVDLEVIVVDDGSVDATAVELGAIADPRVRVLTCDVPGGVAAARNRGIDAATGEFVAFLDDDDVWAPQKLLRQVQAARAAGAGFAYTGTVAAAADGRVIWAFPASPPESVLEDLHGHNVVGTPSCVLARTDLLRDVGGFDVSFAILADWDLWLRLARRTDAVVCSDALTGYVIHATGMHLTDVGRVELEFRRLSARHETDGPLGDDHYMLWLAAAHRDAGRRFTSAAQFARLGLRRRNARDAALALALATVGERGLSGVRRLRRGRSAPAAPAWLADALTAADQ